MRSLLLKARTLDSYRFSCLRLLKFLNLSFNQGIQLFAQFRAVAKEEEDLQPRKEYRCMHSSEDVVKEGGRAALEQPVPDKLRDPPANVQRHCKPCIPHEGVVGNIVHAENDWGVEKAGHWLHLNERRGIEHRGQVRQIETGHHWHLGRKVQSSCVDKGNAKYMDDLVAVLVVVCTIENEALTKVEVVVHD